MTDRISGFLVILEKDIREDDGLATLDAIKQIRGVLSVEPYIDAPEVAIATARVKMELRAKLWDVFTEKEAL